MSAPKPAPEIPGFSTPPAEPMDLVQAWFDSAVALAVREPGALALATADARGHASNRMVRVLAVRDTGLVFASRAGSRKGRDMAETGWASGVLYWREDGRQVIVTGPTHPLPDAESDVLWTAWRARALRLGRTGLTLSRPAAWLGYLLEPESVEFSQPDPTRLRQKLRYERVGSGWRADRLQS
ncbi:pyridoxamine 5'-phosphate oxidase family protein [Sinosporangium siamense]|uniref:Pyridoxamine 5'-phosphate oxidase n=1 Tax=Sinosporangium siamense TaxID=1367973 RepID=A0A919RE01_9ACTN|nr:pyridoxamine 5'-phosphate oxidase family protein [Sinosporangium siamense]GII90039.1 pyridoxamine 5'-phosphate oxidase [Sinosporangium siamense]